MPARMSDAESAHYRSEGYVKGIRVLEPAELDEVREKYLEFTAALRALGLTHHQVNGWWGGQPLLLLGVRHPCNPGPGGESHRPRHDDLGRAVPRVG